MSPNPSPICVPTWKEPKGAAVLTVVPHQMRIRTGESLGFDVFLWNRSDEPLWIEKELINNLHLWVHILNEFGQEIDFPRRKPKVVPPTSRDHFLQLHPGTSWARYDLYWDRVALSQPGWYTVKVEYGRELGRLCAACFGLSLADVQPASFQVLVEGPSLNVPMSKEEAGLEADDFSDEEPWSRREARKQEWAAKWAALAALSPAERLRLSQERHQADCQRDRVILDVHPHATRIGVGEALHLDVFVRNQGETPVWVEGNLDYLDFHGESEQGERIEFPGWKAEGEPDPPISRDDFVRLMPGMSFGWFDLTGDRLVFPELGRFTVTVWSFRYEAGVCARCHQIDYDSPRHMRFEVEVE